MCLLCLFLILFPTSSFVRVCVCFWCSPSTLALWFSDAQLIGCTPLLLDLLPHPVPLYLIISCYSSSRPGMPSSLEEWCTVCFNP